MSALLFVVSAAIIAMVRVPFVSYAPGASVDLLGSRDGKPVVSIEGVPSVETTGQLRLTTVAVTGPDAGITLPEALVAWWSADREVYPREAIYPAGTKAEDVRAREVEEADTARAAAIAAGLREAGVEVRQMPVVRKVATQGPSMDLLRPGDFVTSVDGEATPTRDAVEKAIRKHAVGETVTFGILRDQQPRTVTVETVAHKVESGRPVVGITFGTGFTYTPRVHFAVDPGVGGASGGLMMALAVFDRVNPGDLARGRVIAGTGEVDGLGNVGKVSGVLERIAGAERAGASVFVLPAANCVDVTRPTTLRLVAVSTVDDAVNALDALDDPATEGLVKGCT